MTTTTPTGGRGRKGWIRPEIRRLNAGSAEAIQINGVPDGGPPGQSRS